MNNLDINELDPRAFLNAYTYLWVNNTTQAHLPLMRGNMVIPVRLIEFVLENAATHPIGGEHCIKLGCAYWECPTNVYIKKTQPQYRGKVSLYTPDLIDGKLYQRATKIRNIKIDRYEREY